MGTLLEAEAAHRKIDLVLLDINMPGDSGFVMIAEIRNRPRLHSTPVVMCTGSSHEADFAQARLFGAVGYIVKPPSLARLRKILDLLPIFELFEDRGTVRLMSGALDQ
jgi:CheY-like chemotaxis protein